MGGAGRLTADPLIRYPPRIPPPHRVPPLPVARVRLAGVVAAGMVAPVARRLGKGRQVDDGFVRDQAARDQPVTDDAHIPPEPGGRVNVEGAPHDAVEEVGRIGRGCAPAVASAQGVDRVGADQLRQERRVGRGLVEEVESVTPAGDGEHRAHVIVARPHAAHVVVERLLVVFEHGAHRAGLRGSVQRLGLLGKRIPHLALIGAPAPVGPYGVPHALQLFGPAASVLHTVGHTEAASPVRPPPHLHARHRDDRGALGRDQHGEVGDAVLLGAHQFLAVNDQHRLRSAVLDGEFRHAASLGDLADGNEILLQPPLQQEVGERTGAVRGQREDGQSPVSGGFRELQAGDGGLDVVHWVPLYVGSNYQSVNSTRNHQ